MNRREGEGQRKDRSDRSDEWIKPAVPEARRARRVILLARVPTTLSRARTRERALVDRQAEYTLDSVRVRRILL